MEDKRGAQCLARAARRLDLDAGEAAVARLQAHHMPLIDHRHVRERADAPPNRFLEQRPTQQHAVEPAVELGLVLPMLIPAHVTNNVAGNGAGGDELFGQSREQLVK